MTKSTKIKAAPKSKPLDLSNPYAGVKKGSRRAELIGELIALGYLAYDDSRKIWRCDNGGRHGINRLEHPSASICAEAWARLNWYETLTQLRAKRSRHSRFPETAEYFNKFIDAEIEARQKAIESRKSRQAA